MNYVERLRALRQDHDLSQATLGEVLNKTQQGYSHLENYDSKFTIEDLIKLCLYYNVSADYILGLPKNLDYPER